MKNTSLRMKVLSGMLCAGLTFSGTNISFAAVKESGNTSGKLVTSINFTAPMEEKKSEKVSHAKMRDTFEVVIKESVESKIITKAEGEKVLKYVEEKVENKCGDKDSCKKEKGYHAKAGLLNELVTDGILTKEKAEAISEKMHAKKSQIKIEELQKGLTTLVNSKVLTVEQRNKVEKVIMAAYDQRKEEYKKMRSMNEKEREEHVKKIKDNMVDPLKVLVENNTITKEQEKEIRKVLHHHHNHHNEHK